ncbi:MAG: (p)ppGpp synthase/HD superfamily hydrolase [Verrucomicrobiales bacterium]|jgi:(p)ppGpp synthase/HD superfamily hydrolase
MSEFPTPAPAEVDLVQRAISFTSRAHLNQGRKDGKTPYVAHPFRVFFVVRQVFGIEDPVALCAALLHDTIEDTTTDYDDLRDDFGSEVADAVAALTKDMRLPDEVREPSYDEQLAAASWQARLVKLADVYDNVCDAYDSKMRGRAVKKGPRAIACAGDDEQLAGAVEILQQLLKRAKS